uniref:PHR domain-containing protein n=1 Tax=Macrostomum lignano TaxID=282301 RepID=A0A1I8JLE0_9PLAT
DPTSEIREDCDWEALNPNSEPDVLAAFMHFFKDGRGRDGTPLNQAVTLACGCSDEAVFGDVQIVDAYGGYHTACLKSCTLQHSLSAVVSFLLHLLVLHSYLVNCYLTWILL